MRYSSTFPTSVGIEYTFVPKLRNLSIDERRLVASYAAKLLAVSHIPHYTRTEIHAQDGAVEVPSPVHRDRKRMRAFAEILFNATSELRLTPRHVILHKNGQETFLGTGGGHVHVGIPKGMSRKEKTLFLRNMAIDSFNRPELQWFFQEWHENEALPDYVRTPHKLGNGAKRIATAPLRVRAVPVAFRTKESLHLGWTKNTLEFRLFDAPRDLSMVERNVDFALAYTMYHKQLAQRGVVVRLKKAEVLGRAKWSGEQTRRKLEMLFRKLGLRYESYHTTYWPNYEMRREYGKL